jgi:hypothetical protein
MSTRRVQHPLFDLMRPPVDPSLDGLDSWEATETALGVRLPDQVKQFVDTYGLGRIGDELYVLSYRVARNRFAKLRDGTTNGMNLPLPLHPDAGPALFPLAATGDTSYVYGVVRNGVVADDVIWVGDLKYPVWTRENGPFLDFLYRFLDGGTPQVYEDGNLSPLDPEFLPSSLA